MNTVSLSEEIRQLASVNLFDEMRGSQLLVGRPFALNFNGLRLISHDAWKQRAGGVPAGAFLLCEYQGEAGIDEALLLRVLGPTGLPSDSDVIASMVEYFKEGSDAPLDSFTRTEFQFSGLECRVLGTFYRDSGGITRFAGDLDNFYSPHNYRCVKPTGALLRYIVNFREEAVEGGPGDVRIGRVRYSASQRHASEDEVPVYVSTYDFLGKRTALFGMTRTGKSNSAKKIIQATQELAKQGEHGPIGQIVFDINGEYANANQQDDGTALFQQYPDAVRYSVLEKVGFRTMKLNFYSALSEGHGLLAALMADDAAIYTRAFCAIDWETPDATDRSATARFERRVACYQACLAAAGFATASTRVRFSANRELRGSGIPGIDGVDPSKGISPQDAIAWFTAAWENYSKSGSPFESYRAQNGRDWAEDDLKTLMRFLTRASKPGAAATEAGFRKLVPYRGLHTTAATTTFENDIVELLRAGRIVIIDLSQGDPVVQGMYSDRLCRRIFADAMSRFIANEQANFIQLYFEEAHNLFPRREERDLTLIYNRLAKEGQKLRLGLIYATQEVSSISSSILKNTQNWFISHLNNRDELRELDKYYDFEDFTDSLRRTNDMGFVRLKTDSNAFIVPIQVDRFRVPTRLSRNGGA